MRPAAPAMTAVLAVLLAACSAVPASRPAPAGAVRIYIVERGDSLSEIAAALGVSMKALAAENGLAPPYTIHPGQRLRLPGSGRLAASTPIAAKPAAKPAPAPTYAPAPAPAPAPSQRPMAQTTREYDAPAIAWPTDGAVTGKFGMLTSAGKPNDGIELSLLPGQRILSASGGTVLFAGNEPRFGQLVIVDHGNGWATAYGFSGQITVKQGDAVTYRERIGVAAGSGRTLHFELRRDNVPRDPMIYLPPRL
jgi:lipoprotein NlpD